MKTRNVLVLSGIMLLLAMINISSIAVADYEPVGGGPGDDLQVYFLKKTFDFCDDAVGTGPADIPGGAVPDGMDVQTAGCVDRWTFDGELKQDRRDNYAFTGEQIGELVVARDLDGAIAITHAILKVDENEVAYCNDVTADYLTTHDCAREGNPGDYIQCLHGHFWRAPDHRIMWAEHEVLTESQTSDSGILAEYPPQKSESTRAGFDARYDKIFECFLTVTDTMGGESGSSSIEGASIITVEVYDVVNADSLEPAVTDDQVWFFNPAVSLAIELSEGTAIEFESGYAGDLVYSTNKLLLENAADGGVDIAVWLGGTDLTSPDMAAKCPWSNVLDVEDAMEFKCNLDNGLYIEQEWQQVENKNSKWSCSCFSDGIDGVATCLGLNPLFKYHDNVLENGHEADCSFKLTYPVPCIGEFTDGNLIILMRAI